MELFDCTKLNTDPKLVTSSCTNCKRCMSLPAGPYWTDAKHVSAIIWITLMQEKCMQLPAIVDARRGSQIGNCGTPIAND